MAAVLTALALTALADRDPRLIYFAQRQPTLTMGGKTQYACRFICTLYENTVCVLPNRLNMPFL